MLTCPGSDPGPEWMRSLGDSTVSLRQLRRAILRIIVVFAIIEATATVIADIAVYRAHGRHVRSYNSPTEFAGMPLLSVGPKAHGVIAYGGVATGIVAMGGVTAGVVAFGGLSVGIFAFGGLSAGVLVLAAVALGWRAIGAVAIGHAALGSLAIGRYAYAGPGVAFGYHEASGKQKESLLENQVSHDKSVRAVLKRGIAQLRDAHVPSFTLAAELLLLHVLGRDRTWIYAHPEDEVSASDAERYSALVRRRAAGEPTQHLTGKQEFWGLEFEVTADVLIPRPETEHLIEVALDRLAVREIRAGRRQTLTGEGLRIADIGTGSGCIAVALAKELPAATIYATDISPAALAVARRNAIRHGVADRVHFFQSNLLDGLVVVGAQHAAPFLGNQTVAGHESRITSHESRSFDLIVSNPPYVGRRETPTLMREVREHESEVALYGGEEGYEFYADLITQAATNLKSGGILVLELGHNTLPAVQPLLDSSQWVNVGVTNDLSSIPRVLAAEKA